MAYTKKVARHDKIMVDGTDVSNSFNNMGVEFNDDTVDVSGYSASGTDESVSGGRAQAFVGTALYTEELAAVLYPLYSARTIFDMSWQPDGLVDATREVYLGNVQLRTFAPASTRGAVYEMPFRAEAADSTGIVASDFT